MNVYAVVILAALVLEYALGALATVLELRSLAPTPPAALRDVVDDDTWARSQAYTRARSRFGLVASSVRLAALLGFWGLGGFAAVAAVVARLDAGPVVGGVAYIAAIALLGGLLSLPLSLWSTFVIEQRFGFNRTTLRTFLLDRLKGLLVGAALGLPLLAAVVAFFVHAGAAAWLWAWIASGLFLVVVQVLVPRFVMPLFNRFAPLPDGALRDALLAYARRVSFPLEEVYVMDGSRRSGKGNAFFTGFGRHKRIALFDTLVARHPVPELVAITAHEVGHHRKGHILLGTVLSVLHAGVLFALLSVFLGAADLFAAFGVAAPSVGVGLVLFGLLYTPVELVLSVLLSALSRRNEYAADRFAAETTAAPEALAAALKRLATDNLANLTPHPLNVALRHSHPPVVDRIAALRRLAAPPPRG